MAKKKEELLEEKETKKVVKKEEKKEKIEKAKKPEKTVKTDKAEKEKKEEKSKENKKLEKMEEARKVTKKKAVSKIEKEELSLYERYNDRIVTALRTSDGLDLNRLKSDFGQTLYDHCLQAAAPHLRDGLIERISSTREKQVPNDLLKLTRRGLFLSDGIMSDLLYVAD